MDRNFARALSLVLKSEGGWADNPADHTRFKASAASCGDCPLYFTLA